MLGRMNVTRQLHTPGMPRTSQNQPPQTPRPPQPEPPAEYDTVVLGGLGASVLLGVGIIVGTVVLNPPPKPPQAQELPAPAPAPVTGITTGG